MNQTHIILAAIGVVLAAFIIIGCSREREQPIGDADEESGTQLTLSEIYDHVRNGARLILAYEVQSDSFKGTVENTTSETLKQVRVEVHLSNGKELGPTAPTDLAPGEKIEVLLIAMGTDFESWNAHPEVGEGEHSHGKEHGEHDSEHGSEHN